MSSAAVMIGALMVNSILTGLIAFLQTEHVQKVLGRVPVLTANSFTNFIFCLNYYKIE